MHLLWTRQASQQLRAAFSYMGKEGSPQAAAKQIEAVLTAVEQLRSFPELGRPGRVAGTRELVIQGTPYVVAYRIRQNAIRILALLHGARRWPTEF